MSISMIKTKQVAKQNKTKKTSCKKGTVFGPYQWLVRL